MKTGLTHLFLLRILTASLCLIIVGPIMAQTFTTLHNFMVSSTNSLGVVTNSDGLSPRSLILSGDVLYGTTGGGGRGGNGTVFKENTDGSGFSTLHSFTGSTTNSSGTLTNFDGANPYGSLVLSNNTLCGTANRGGAWGNGTVFAVNTDGTRFTNLYQFTATSTNSPDAYANSDGALPSGLLASDDTLYGTTYQGGSWGYGTVFRVGTDGTRFASLYSFTGGPDGGGPFGLLLSGQTLYGTAGLFFRRTAIFLSKAFKVNTDGTGFTNLLSLGFFGIDYSQSAFLGQLTLADNVLFGPLTVVSYGIPLPPRQTVCSIVGISTDGSGYNGLYSFTPLDNGTNNEGFHPGPLISSGNTLYGTAGAGGGSGSGTVFKVNTDGTGFMELYSFTGTSTNSSGAYTNSDGASPNGLILSGNALYGTASEGGNSGSGTIFRISFAPQLAITPSATNINLTWPTNYAGFDYTGYHLQSTTNLASPVWTANLPAPVIVNGQNIVTNPVSGTQQFFRLSQ